MDSDMQDVGEVYHDFSLLGLKTRQLPGIFAPNQQVKAPVIQAYILLALAKLACERLPASFVEWFCADGYYAMFARKFGACSATGIDSDRDGFLPQASAIAAALGLVDVDFRKQDVNELNRSEKFTIVANVGGLYHVSNPEDVLELSYAIAERYLIVQTVVSMATDDPEYFETPAPGQRHGSRYSKQSFEQMIHRKQWHVLDTCFATLDANPRLEDRGSLFYLIEKREHGGRAETARR
jgi:Methyltransferase domain